MTNFQYLFVISVKMKYREEEWRQVHWVYNFLGTLNSSFYNFLDVLSLSLHKLELLTIYTWICW